MWYPATSSCSASGKSNGARLVSAMPAVMKMKKPTGCRNTNHFGMNPNQYPDCALTRSTSDSELPSTSTAASAVP